MRENIRIDITIPLFYNNNEPIEQVKFDKIRRELIRQFGGLTISNDNEGYWIGDLKQEYHDISRIYSVMCDNNKDNINWFKGYKKWLEYSLEQYEIFILVSEVDRL